MLSHPGAEVQSKKIGVEASHSFGDTVFNVPLIKAIHDHYGHKVTVAVRPQYKDGFYNVPWINKIRTINGMWHGYKMMKDEGYELVFQITQNAKFPEYKKSYPNHSLIDTPLWIGREIGLPDFDQKPMFFPTDKELDNTKEVLNNKPAIAIECEARSGQSWANGNHINQIVEKYKDTHRILWLSNKGAPKLPCVDDLLRFTRREVIMCLRAADIFFSVGSGFFCASLALPEKWQPKKIVCLWKDNFFKYVDRLNQVKWHKELIWVVKEEQFKNTLKNL